MPIRCRFCIVKSTALSRPSPLVSPSTVGAAALHVHGTGGQDEGEDGYGDKDAVYPSAACDCRWEDAAVDVSGHGFLLVLR